MAMLATGFGRGGRWILITRQGRERGFTLSEAAKNPGVTRCRVIRPL